jgi:FixJ family two-component response regulator
MQKLIEKVFVIDNDLSVCLGLSRLLNASGYQVEVFHSATEFLDREDYAGIACIILDVSMPQISGLDLQLELNAQQCGYPIIFLTGHGDLPMGIQAMKRGAEDFLPKPIDESILLEAVSRALQTHRKAYNQKRRQIESQTRLKNLTPREMQVLQCLLSGAINKKIAEGLSISEKTVKAHRAKVMEKMGASSAVELGSACSALGVLPVSVSSQKGSHKSIFTMTEIHL